MRDSAHRIAQLLRAMAEPENREKEEGHSNHHMLTTLQYFPM
jgi:hypothetical protein